MIEQMMKIFGYHNNPIKSDGTEWAEKTIEKFAAGGMVSDTELFYANRILETKSEKRGRY